MMGEEIWFGSSSWDALQSRVNSVARLIGLGFSPLSLALTGWLLQYSTPQVTILLSVGGSFFWRWSPP
jgi:hypothetical protein